MLAGIVASGTRRELAIVTPPVEPDFLRFVQGADEKPNTDGEQLDFRERYFGRLQ